MPSKLVMPVLRAYAANAERVKLLLEVAAKLDGPQDAPFLLILDDDLSKEEDAKLVELAGKAFPQGMFAHMTSLPPSLPWPQPQNRSWQEAARWIADHDHIKLFPNTRGWLWWEHDACPLRKGWLQALSDAHAKGRKLFTGHPCISPDGGRYMNGVGIYPLAIIDPLADCASLYARNRPFDMVGGPCMMRSFNPIPHLLLHEKKLLGGTGGSTFSKGRLNELLKEHPQAVFYHGADETLPLLFLGRLREQKPATISTKLRDMPGRSTFYHSGDYGDLFYSLLTVRELGGGDLLLGPDNRSGMATRQKWTPQLVQPMLPLLEAQPYVHTATFSEHLPPKLTYDLNAMRLLLRDYRLDMQPGYNLARCYLQAFGLPLENDRSAWLTVPSPVAKAPVVINRTSRYQNPRFRWDRILATYPGQCIFVGTPAEHASFTQQWGYIPHEPTRDFLEAAQLIAGCKLFVGNQSACYAIAEGLKKPAILETCPGGSNTLFDRPDAVRNLDDTTSLPDVGKRPRPPKLSRHLTLAGPVDYYTGLGRITCQLATQLADRGYKVRLEPDTLDQRLPLPEGVKQLLKARPAASGPRVLVCPLLQVPERLRSGDHLFTMWESTRFAPVITHVINEKAAQLLTPSSWCATVFSANGVQVPLRLVPLGVDTDIYKPDFRAPEPKGVTVFGAAGRLAHGGTRKGIEDVIAAFLMAFPEDERVELRLKLHGDCPMPVITDKRILVFTSNWTDEEMAKWYHGLDVFISASKAEGWGLHAHEALACGVPIIAPSYSGLADLVPPYLHYTIVEATEGYSGHWCQPSVAHLAEMLLRGQCSPSFLAKNVPTLETMTTALLEALQ